MPIVSRDPFSRTEIHKSKATGECRECGGKNSHGHVWQFRNESDGGRKSDIPGVFCGVRCMRAYHCVEA